MTTVQVRRVTIALCGVFLAAAVAFAWLSDRRASSPAPLTATGPALSVGAPIFASRCGACHAAEAIAQLIRDAPDRRAKMHAIDALLVSHGEASPGDVRQILAYLESLAR